MQCPIRSLLLHPRYSGEQGELVEHHIILGLQAFVNDIEEKSVIYGLWICNFFFAQSHAQSMEYSEHTYDNWSFCVQINGK